MTALKPVDMPGDRSGCLSRSAGTGDNDRRRSERGSVTIFVLLTMIMSLFFVTLAIDMSLLANLRADAQAGVDIAALAGAHDISVDPTDLATVEATVKASLNSNLSDPPTDTEMNTCGAEPLSPEWTKLTAANCIAVVADTFTVRVRLPDRRTNGVFSQVFGVDSFAYTAVAVAEAELVAAALPFWLGSDAGIFGCLKSGSLPDDAPCDGHDGSSGNFGYSAHAQYGNAAKGTTPQPPDTSTLKNNIAMGIDHRLSRLAGAPYYGSAVLDDEPYPPKPNTVGTETGNMSSLAGEALFYGDGFPDGRDALLTRWDGLSWGTPVTIGPHLLDDEPLWAFIGDLSGSAVPTSCAANQFNVVAGQADLSFVPAGVATHLATQYDDGDASTFHDQDLILTSLMLRCMDHYQGLDFDDNGKMAIPESPIGCAGPCTDPVFTRNDAVDRLHDDYDIQYSPRFGYAPQATVPASTVSGSTDLAIGRFSPIFLHRLYAGSCSSNRCNFEHSPGIPPDIDTKNIGNVKTASGMSNFVIPDAMLPGNLGSPDGPNVHGSNIKITLKS
ncbi:MAG: pilus assembly protein TadG-related protein [Acidimicrobiia bacterium]|nr:pilus assembly protein TadG-related protein [Acidimicrobiia bacterium]